MYGVFPDAAHAQQPPPPWTGVAMNEAHSEGGPQAAGGSGFINPHALSSDGRFITFTSSSPLMGVDTNGTYDVYVRDRHNGFLSRASVSSAGIQANGPSLYASMSADGRHVAFQSCATNLDPADTNGQCDVFVHDRQTGATSVVNIGPNGQRGNFAGISIRLSGDGRFIVFTDAFPGFSSGAYLRDRDPDANGVFDEPGLSTTVNINVTELDGQFMGGGIDVAINFDGSMIAYTSYTNDENWNNLGPRLYLYDRINDTTVRVDRPLPSGGDIEAYSHDPDFSDNGLLVFATNIPNLVIGDLDAQHDIFVYDIATTQRTRLELTHANAPDLNYVYGPTISADGRYVAFTGEDGVDTGLYDIYAIDRHTSESYEISVRYDGTRDGQTGWAAISADGSAIAFNGSWQFLANPDGYGVYVSTAVSVSPLEVEVETPYGSVSVDVNVPADMRWWARVIKFDPDQYSMILAEIYEGIGPTTLNIDTGYVMGAEDQDWVFALGTATVLLRERLTPQIQNVDPYIVSPSGGSSFTVNGIGFSQGATVLIGDVPATDVVVDEWGQWITATAPPHEETIDFLPVTVVNPNGKTATEDYGVIYYAFDETPPVLEAQLSGTEGQNGWWVSNVFVGWTLNDPESELYDVNCENVLQTTDTDSRIATCTASSDGGTSSVQVEFKRDATAPSVSISSPESIIYTQGQQVALDFACADAMSEIANCAPSQAGGYLDTSAAGTFSFSVTATDNAGNTATTSISYTVKTVVQLTVAPASATYGGDPATFTATLNAGATGVAGKTVKFYLDNQIVDAVTTSSSGIATSVLSLNGRTAGSYLLRADFEEDATTFSASDTDAFVIAKATPALTWNAPSAIAYGTALSATQLNASASVGGSFSYDPAAGAVLSAGTHSLTASFTPTDTANYNSGSAGATIAVSKADPVLTWNNPAAIVYGTALSGTQLNASANVPGSFAYSPAAGAILGAGTHSLGATFTPGDTANYNAGTASVSLNVTPKALSIQTDTATKVYGQALPAFSVSGTGFVNGDGVGSLSGTATFSTLATATSAPGNYSVTPGGLSSPNYTITFVAGTLAITNAATSVALSTSPNPSTQTQNVVMTAVVSPIAPGAGTPTGTVQFRDNGVLLGTATLVNGTATMTKKFKRGTHPLTATYAGNTNFNGSTGASSHVVP